MTHQRRHPSAAEAQTQTFQPAETETRAFQPAETETQAFQSTDQAEAQTQALQPAVQKVGEPELASANQRGDSVDELVAALSEEEQ